MDNVIATSMNHGIVVYLIIAASAKGNARVNATSTPGIIVIIIVVGSSAAVDVVGSPAGCDAR